MGIYNTKKKVLAPTTNNNIIIVWIYNCCKWRINVNTIYLCNILEQGTAQRNCGSTQPTKKNSRKSDNGFNFWGFNSFFDLSMVMVLKK